MGIAGAFVPDSLTENLKTNRSSSEMRPKTYGENLGNISKLRDKDQTNLIDDEGLPLVYS